MKETKWMNKKEYRQFLKTNKFIKVHSMEYRYKKQKEFENVTDKKIYHIKWDDFVKVTYSNIEV